MVSSEKFAFGAINSLIQPVPLIDGVRIVPAELHHTAIANPIHDPPVRRPNDSLEVDLRLLALAPHLLVYVLEQLSADQREHEQAAGVYDQRQFRLQALEMIVEDHEVAHFLVFEHIDFQAHPPQPLLVDAPTVDFDSFQIAADDVFSFAEDVERGVADESLLRCDFAVGDVVETF